MSETYRCRWCHVPVGYWVHGWKHQNSGTTGLRSCGRKLTQADIEPREASEQRDDAEAKAIVAMLRERWKR